MAKKDALSEYSIEELYTREEAADRLNRGIGTIDRALSLGMFTTTRLAHSKKTYLLKSEVEHMVGYDEAPLTSKKAQARLSAFRRQHEVEKMNGSLDDLPAKSIEREVSHAHLESESMRAFRMMNETLSKAFELAFGSRSISDVR